VENITNKKRIRESYRIKIKDNYLIVLKKKEIEQKERE
jgi:hypothetical protein